MKRKQHLLLFVFFIATLFIAWLIASDIKAITSYQIKIDAVGHFIGFFILTWFIHYFLKLPLFELVITLCSYAALTELAQLYLGYRNGEFSDFIADILGVNFYVLLNWAFIVYGKPKRE